MDRRSFLVGAGASLIAAPAIVRAASLMPVKPISFLQFGHRAADPVLLTAGDDLIYHWVVISPAQARDLYGIR